MKKTNQFEVQDVQLWPNTLSLDQNKTARQRQIQRIIDDTKTNFLIKNKEALLGSNYESFLDHNRDIYYPPKTNEPSFCKAGLHYSIPDEAVGIGLKVDPQYEDEKQWAVLYHGTKPNSLLDILREGLKPGRGQAHQGTTDPQGNKVPRGVYFSFWMNQSFYYTLPDNPIILQCFVKEVYVAPGTKGYAVSNISKISRILIPLDKNRNNQLI